MLPFIPYTPSEPVDTSKDIPKDMDIFYRDAREFLPPGKDFKDLTPKELEEVQNKYRFDCLKPGVYQGVTGISSKHNSSWM
jgi:hypothetical protein